MYFDAIRDGLEKCGRIMHGGTIVDATIIAAPSSTKNAFRERDPEMHQTQKGNQWHFGMKMHAGVDAGTGYIHTITATTANVHDVDQAAELIREDDTVVYGDAAYLGIEKRDEVRNDPNKSAIDYRINLRPGKSQCSGGRPCQRLVSYYGAPEVCRALQSRTCFPTVEESLRLQQSQIPWY